MAKKLNEAQYLELYNHLPTGSKDLVLGKNKIEKQSVHISENSKYQKIKKKSLLR
jgi:uncharacterized membrane-anchored protein YhcB (DUF1043 family)